MALLASAGVPLPNVDSELAFRLRRCIQIGLLCVQTRAEQDDRPDMPAVVRMLFDHNEPIRAPRMAAAPIPTPIEEEEDVASPPQERWIEEDAASLQEARLSRRTVYETLDLS